MQYRYKRKFCGPLQAVLFDLSGTLVDFGSCAPVIALQRLFAKHGLNLGELEARAPMDSEKRQHIARMLAQPALRAEWTRKHGKAPDQALVEQLFAEFEPIQRQAVEDRLRLVPGAAQAMRQLRANGLRIGFNTGYSRAMAQPILDFMQQQDLAADSVVCGPEVPRARPSPQMALRNLLELEIDQVAACVKVDDAEAGIEEGLNAGLWTVGVAVSGNANGMELEDWLALDQAEQRAQREAAHHRLARSGAHFVIDSVAELMPCMEYIQKQVSRGNRP